jgi:hypothetical protein
VAWVSDIVAFSFTPSFHTTPNLPATGVVPAADPWLLS